MIKKNLILFVMTIAFSQIAYANNDWFQHSAISPDARSVLFSYKGDIYKVPTSGGVAQPLTIHSAWEGYPI
ncbi:MAG: hypothetical protein AAF512_09495, partial [Pseudomonadota bacterium]